MKEERYKGEYAEALENGKILDAQIRKLCGMMKSVDEKIDGLAMWREWRMTGLLRGFMYGSVMIVVQWVGRGRGGFIP